MFLKINEGKEERIMEVYELKYKVFLLQSIPQEEALIRVSSCIDHILIQEEKWKYFHSENIFKGYTFCAPFPLAKGGYYTPHSVYQILIRTVNAELGQYLADRLPKYEDAYMKGLICDVRCICQRHISSLYSITPVIVKGENNNYWRDTMKFEQFEEQIRINLIKKYKALFQEELGEDFLLNSFIELKNRVPIKNQYKNVHLLGDKIQMQVSEHPTAQMLAYLALGSGIGTMNQRGYGFVNAKF